MNGLSLGKKIQEIRSAKGFSVRKTANLAEITPSMLSQIENDLVNPSINTLRCIANALDTPIYMFFREEDHESPVVHPEDRLSLGFKSAPDVRYELLTPDTKGSIEFRMMIIPAGMSSYRDARSHEGEELDTEIRADGEGTGGLRLRHQPRSILPQGRTDLRQIMTGK